MASVAFEGVSKQFGAVEVLKGIDLAIRDGEFAVVVGPSGCGKSTLLRLLAGLEMANKGRLKIGERVINTMPAQSRNIAMVFQNYALYPHMTVEQNIDFGLRMRGTDKAARARLVAEAASILQLEPYLQRLPRQLSGGQRQRVAMARAMVREPDVLLMDEPLSNLDAQLRVQVRAEIKKLQHRLGVTTLYVTHDQVEAMTMADRIAVLRNGRLEQFGTPDELYGRPVNRFVAEFIGTPSINLFPADHLGGGRFRLNGGIELEIPPHRLAEAPREGQIMIGVRPRHVAVAPGTDAAGVRWRAPVHLCEPLGDEMLLHTRLGEHTVIAKAIDRPAAREGEEAGFGFVLENAHLFSATSGACISAAPQP